MDLSQEKPTRSEWQNLEIPVSEEEKRILQLLMSGYHDPDIHKNQHVSIASYMKIAPQDVAMDAYIYGQFFQESIQGILGVLPEAIKAPILPPVKKQIIKKSDMIRIEQMKKKLFSPNGESAHIFEFVLLDLLTCAANHKNTNQWITPIYTLIQFQITVNIDHVNSFVRDFVEQGVAHFKPLISCRDLVLQSTRAMEQNMALIKYADSTLYSHQKELFRMFQNTDTGKLVLYTAPTGTGKTLSPLALAQNNHCVIFLCSARHVGLGLAKAAISMEKRVAFAYGCNSAEDIRLHNFSAVDYSVHKKSGAIWKVDNSNGIRVEIMICDMKSYLIAMKYMMEFHSLESLILYWDEPTITMDYETHPLHDWIHRNWVENCIPNVVLSCATLPKSEEISATLNDFRCRFEGAEIHSIVSHDCKKSIKILDTRNQVVLPHLLFDDDPISLQRCVEHCRQNKTMLRYMDLGEIVRFLELALSTDEWEEYFPNDIALVTMKTIKNAYLRILADKLDSKMMSLLKYLKETQKSPLAKMNGSLQKIQSLGSPCRQETPLQGNPLQKIQSVCDPQLVSKGVGGILFTTEDAQTLTDGPTIYLAENVEKLGLFYIHQTQFPVAELKQLLGKIHSNHLLEQTIQSFENQMEDHLGKENLKEKKMIKENFTKEVRMLKSQIELHRAKMEKLAIRPVLVPNSREHLEKFMGTTNKHTSGNSRNSHNPFTSRIEESDVIQIMKSEIDDTKKILLLLGIGVFSQKIDPKYLEIIKSLANEQKLYLILASSDYIYGTNYQFCHGVLGKDLKGMTQQKMIQALGRVGRNNIQQDYTVRFRDDDILKTLFLPMESNLEAVNMSRLLLGRGNQE